MTPECVAQIGPMPARQMQSVCVNDAMLIDAFTRALRQKGYDGLRRIEVEVDGNSVRLKGAVPSFHLKQLAQSIVQQVSGSYQVQNEIEVPVGG